MVSKNKIDLLLSAVESDNSADILRIVKENPELRDENCLIMENAINIATVFGRSHSVRALLEIDPGLGTKSFGDKNPVTPAHTAAKRGDLECLKVLVEISPGCVYTTDIWKCSPALIAARYDHVDCLDYLLCKFPDLVNSKSSSGETMAHLAAMGDSTKTLKYILERSGELALARNSKGRIPLHYALEFGYFDSARIIIGMFPQILETGSSLGFKTLLVLVDEAVDNDEALAFVLKINPLLAGYKDEYGYTAIDHAASDACKILLAWYQKHVPENEPSVELKEFLYAVRSNTLLSTRTAKKLASLFQVYWPEGLKELLLLSASPSTARSIIDSEFVSRSP